MESTAGDAADCRSSDRALKRQAWPCRQFTASHRDSESQSFADNGTFSVPFAFSTGLAELTQGASGGGLWWGSLRRLNIRTTHQMNPAAAATPMISFQNSLRTKSAVVAVSAMIAATAITSAICPNALNPDDGFSSMPPIIARRRFRRERERMGERGTVNCEHMSARAAEQLAPGVDSGKS